MVHLLLFKDKHPYYDKEDEEMNLKNTSVNEKEDFSEKPAEMLAAMKEARAGGDREVISYDCLEKREIGTW